MKTIFKKFSPHQMALLICYVLVYLLICLLHATLICYKDKCSTGCQKLFIEPCRCFAFFVYTIKKLGMTFHGFKKNEKPVESHYLSCLMIIYILIAIFKQFTCYGTLCINYVLVHYRHHAT